MAEVLAIECLPHLTRPPRLPQPRGRASETVIEALRNDVHDHPFRVHVDGASDDDLQFALHCCYELHYRTFDSVDEGWEWAPNLLALRRALESQFLERLHDEVGPLRHHSPRAAIDELFALATDDGGPSLSSFMLEHGTFEQMREFAVHRSPYQLKEADPHTWMLPRLEGRAKAAAVTIQHDEYGAGLAADMHATLFADTMVELGLDPSYGAYLDHVPGATLATGNLISLFALHREWRAACVGHLALFEMTSVGPMQRYSATLDRLGFGPRARRFYDVHVEADAWHEKVAIADLVAGLLEEDDQLAGKVVFGAAALCAVERGMAEAMLAAWVAGRSSLRFPLAPFDHRTTTPTRSPSLVLPS